MSKEYSVLQGLPENGQQVYCYGNKTYCCSEDMEDLPNWHLVMFKVNFRYKLKDKLPSDPEESIMEWCEGSESWDIVDEGHAPAHVIGVTKWKLR